MKNLRTKCLVMAVVCLRFVLMDQNLFINSEVGIADVELRNLQHDLYPESWAEQSHT